MPFSRRAIAAALFLAMAAVSLPSAGFEVKTPAPPRKAAYFTHPIDPGTVKATPAPPSPVTQRLLELIDDAAPRGTIRIAVYYLTDYAQPLYAKEAETITPVDDVDQGGQIVAALVRALKRRVRVAIITEAGKTSGRAIRRLTQHGATVRVCNGGCAHQRDGGIMHNKFMLIDDTIWTPGLERVVAQTSANWSDKQLSTQRFNNMLVIWGDVRLYDAYRSHFIDMLKRRRGRMGVGGDRGGGTAVAFFPRTKGDPIQTHLSRSRLPCEPGSTISVAMGKWSGSRGLGLLRLLQARERAGCAVRIVVVPDARIVTGGHLHKAFPNGARCTGDTRHDDLDANDVDPDDMDTDLRPSNHSKYVLINGPYRGVKEAKTVLTGSANFTNDALRRNDEAWITVAWRKDAPPENAAVFAGYAADFERMWESSLPCGIFHPGAKTP